MTEKLLSKLGIWLHKRKYGHNEIYDIGTHDRVVMECGACCRVWGWDREKSK